MVSFKRKRVESDSEEESFGFQNYTIEFVNGAKVENESKESIKQQVPTENKENLHKNSNAKNSRVESEDPQLTRTSSGSQKSEKNEEFNEKTDGLRAEKEDLGDFGDEPQTPDGRPQTPDDDSIDFSDHEFQEYYSSHRLSYLSSNSNENGTEPTHITVYAQIDPKKKCFTLTTKSVSLCGLLRAILTELTPTEDIPIKHVTQRQLALVVQYLTHHQGVMPEEISKPILHSDMRKILEDQFDAEFIESLSKLEVLGLVQAANYMDIQPLLSLGCAKVATLIKGKTAAEVRDILGEDGKVPKFGWDADVGIPSVENSPFSKGDPPSQFALPSIKLPASAHLASIKLPRAARGKLSRMDHYAEDEKFCGYTPVHKIDEFSLLQEVD